MRRPKYQSEGQLETSIFVPGAKMPMEARTSPDGAPDAEMDFASARCFRTCKGIRNAIALRF